MKNEIFIKNGFVEIQKGTTKVGAGKEILATIISNIEYYGFALSEKAFANLKSLSRKEIIAWWNNIEPSFKSVTGDDRDISKFVVYKNFPEEVLNKTDAEYWFAQILMYWGFSNELFTEEEKARPKMSKSEGNRKTLMLAEADTLSSIFKSILSQSAAWQKDQVDHVIYLMNDFEIDLASIPFKENMIMLAKECIANNKIVKVKSATDVLRLGTAMSDGDFTLVKPSKFKSFKRSERKFLLEMLNSSSNLKDDVARRKNVWKKFLRNLHPGDYNFKKVSAVYNELYKNNLESFNSVVETGIINKKYNVFKTLETRPGEFSRRLVHLLDVFGNKAANSFIKVLPDLTVIQLLKIQRVLKNANVRTTRLFTPNGNWAKAQLGSSRNVDSKLADKIIAAIDKELSIKVPSIKELDIYTDNVKLPNGNEEGGYTRGTVLRIPENVKFIRTASYWKKSGFGNCWFDNGWNFFDDNWVSKGGCCWTGPKINGAVFSGDPTSSKEMEGRAAQMIDLYPEELRNSGVRYAVWNILCYNKVKFSQAEDVFAALQWGEDPIKGKLFEPSRCQIAFPLKGDYYTKYICFLDLKTMEITYIDANLKASVRSANLNAGSLSTMMPAVVDYINCLPSVYDLFKNSVDKNGSGKVLYESSNDDIDNEPSYIFLNENKKDYSKIDLNKILRQ